MSILLAALAGVLAGCAGAMGIGGGGFLIIYLTLFAGVDQLTAQGVNLIFFIPCAVVAIIIHWKNRLLDFKKILPAALLGLAGAGLGSYLAGIIGGGILRKIFAGGLLLLGAWTVWSGWREGRKENPG